MAGTRRVAGLDGVDGRGRVGDSLASQLRVDGLTATVVGTLDREGVPAPNGVGAVRRLEAVGPALLEEIIAYQRPTGYTYKLVSGAPVRDHVGTIELREAGTGTAASWHLRSTPTIPGVDWLLTPVLKRVIGLLFNGAIDAAERRA